jgi:hypothetical protein
VDVHRMMMVLGASLPPTRITLMQFLIPHATAKVVSSGLRHMPYGASSPGVSSKGTISLIELADAAVATLNDKDAAAQTRHGNPAGPIQLPWSDHLECPCR